MNVKEFKRICRNKNFYIAQTYVIAEEIKQIELDYYTPLFIAYAIKDKLEQADGEQYNFHVKSIEEVKGSN